MTSLIKNRSWVRNSKNPILRPFPGNAFGETICMNPNVLIYDGTYYLYYAADDASGKRTIRLATAPVEDPVSLTNHGVMVANGKLGSFDAAWCVLPQVIEIEPGTWYLYYTGNQGYGEGLSAFPGMGLAISHDLLHWEKYSPDPVLIPSDEPGIGKAVGIAGGSFLREIQPDGSSMIRFYYTVCPSMGDDVFLDQQKQIHYASSTDGLHWTRHGCILKRNPQHDYENIAVAVPVVRKADQHYEMWYSAIGTRWGFYSICYAESPDGIHWNRGDTYGENLQLGPFTRGLRGDCLPQSWDSQMVEYTAVVCEQNHDRLFYTGNGYGLGGIGTAVSQPIRAVATGTEDGGVKLWHSIRTGCHMSNLLKQLEQAGQSCQIEDFAYGIQNDGDIWQEWHLRTPESQLPFGCRILLLHNAEGLELRCTLLNANASQIDRLSVVMDLPEHYAVSWAGRSPDHLEIAAFESITISGQISYRN